MVYNVNFLMKIECGFNHFYVIQKYYLKLIIIIVTIIDSQWVTLFILVPWSTKGSNSEWYQNFLASNLKFRVVSIVVT